LGTHDEPTSGETKCCIVDAIKQLLKEYKDVFVWTYKDLRGIPPSIIDVIEKLLKEYKDVFAWMYKDLKGIPPFIVDAIEQLLKEYKDVFVLTYKDLRGIPPHLAHQFEFNTNIPVSHQTQYQMNSNYVAVIKQNLDKLLAMGFITRVEQVTWLSPIMVVSKKNGKLRICM
jgi:hypothetical protein